MRSPTRRSPTRLGAAALAALAILPRVAQGQAPATTVAITGVSVVPMDRERVVAGQTVLIAGGRIAAIGPEASVKLPAGTTVVDGRGKYLMPGLAEMHAHVPPPSAPPKVTARVLALYVANGVTTIRGMLGDASHLALRARLGSGETRGPRLITSGPSFNGNSVETVQAGIDSVLSQKRAGYDLLKIHPGVTRQVFDSVAATAGTVAVGRRADLVLVDGNPLADVRNAGRIAGVMLNGRWNSRAEIDRSLDAFRIP